MALSGQYSNKENGKFVNYHCSKVFSNYTFANGSSEVDQTKLVPTFELGMLKLNIYPKIQNSGTDYDKFDTENGASIYLTHTKAKLLLDDAREFFKNPDMATSVGVDSGTGDNQGIIQFSNGAEFGVTHPCLVIRRLDVSNGGSITASFAYEFKTQTHYTIRNFDPNTMNFDRIYHDDLEIEQFFTLLEQYVLAQTNAVAFTVKEQLHYINNKADEKMNAVLEHLGIEIKNNNGNSNNKNSVSIFGDKNSGRSFSTKTIEDIDNM